MIEVGFAALVAAAVCLSMTIAIMAAMLVRLSRRVAQADGLANIEERMSEAVIESNDRKKSEKRKLTISMKSAPPAMCEPILPQDQMQRKQSVFVTVGDAILKKMTGEEEEDIDDVSPGSYLGKIHFGLSYDRETEVLSLHIIQATDLIACDLIGSSDPYVRAWLLPDGEDAMKTTRIHRRSLNPVFNQTLSFEGYTAKKIEEMAICMQVVDHDRFTRDDPMGEVVLPLRSIKLDSCPVYWRNLKTPTIVKKEEGVGEILVSMCYQPERSMLNVTVMKARDLPAKDLTGTSDPYVKLWLIDQGNRVEKHKTHVKSHCLAPVFNETFNFCIVPERMTNKVQLAVTVMDHDILSSNDEIGHVIIGPRGSESGKKQWSEVMANPGVPLGMWHTLSPKF